jgi:hypothetical protein
LLKLRRFEKCSYFKYSRRTQNVRWLASDSVTSLSVSPARSTLKLLAQVPPLPWHPAALLPSSCPYLILYAYFCCYRLLSCYSYSLLYSLNCMRVIVPLWVISYQINIAILVPCWFWWNLVVDTVVTILKN